MVSITFPIHLSSRFITSSLHHHCVLFRSKRATLLKQLEQSYTTSPATNRPKAGPDGSRRSFAAGLSPSGSKIRLSHISSSTSLLLPSATTLGPEDMELCIRTEGNLAYEVGLIILETLDQFTDRFKVTITYVHVCIYSLPSLPPPPSFRCYCRIL